MFRYYEKENGWKEKADFKINIMFWKHFINIFSYMLYFEIY